MEPLKLNNASIGKASGLHRQDEFKGMDYYDKKPGRIKGIFRKTIAVEVNEGRTIYVKKRSAEKYIKNHIGDLPGETKKRSYRKEEIRKLLPIIFNKSSEIPNGFQANPIYNAGNNPLKGKNPLYEE